MKSGSYSPEPCALRPDIKCWLHAHNNNAVPLVWCFLRLAPLTCK